MARPTFQALPGTRDLLPPDTDRISEIVEIFATEASLAGFGQITPPTFEDAGVFSRLGEATDVVQKELYSFSDRGGRNQALRPEFTASVCRAFAQHRPVTPWKTWYYGPAFRQERPQKGRYREFYQVGVEAIGSHDPDLDVEIIALADRFYRRVGLTDLTLMVNTLGDAQDRPAYLDALRAYFAEHQGAMSEQSQETLAINPLRVLDSKRREDAEIVANAPLITDYLSDEAGQAFERVQAGLDALGVSYELRPRLVRGLDYYTRTTFEFASQTIDAAQNAVGGGGRYDGLVADLGGPDEPGIGFGLGVDRILMAAEAQGALGEAAPSVDVWVVATTGGLDAMSIANELRANGIRSDRSFDHRSMKAQMKAANRSGAPIAVIVGEDEAAAGTVTVRPLRSQDQDVDRPQFAVARPDLLSQIKELLES